MKKEVSQVRKSIARRKKMKQIDPKAKSGTSFRPTFLQDEEKHGYFPFAQGTEENGRMRDTFVTSFFTKTIMAAILFFGVAILYRIDVSWSDKPKQLTSQMLTEEFPFASVNQWYQNKFGYPLALTPQKKDQSSETANALPVNGTVSQTFQSNGKGIMITTENVSKVLSMKGGMVTFAGNDRETGKTIKIQHADGTYSIYGNLTSINVFQYEFVGTNDVIGEFDPSQENAQQVYFAIEKDNTFLDPVQVMKVDERP
ncbi:M23 family metallopeptidase [Aquibacillus sp. 3ASR75-11]|uniref:M23 family metallopeptidase n=1 Tax=Terrihalobacillus insolitus TaxID=2950438 RepID=A0A9X3WQ72_9BACI|nr:M23 family metallopeptidase [Terrihalobacillus insolitus]MDC3412467.1 M23 family metallopeptidase [Terrihalobacillus insolitus]MDC3423887.1 M23 family metallopeptidase [Terrihalobacillus insolitus]